MIHNNNATKMRKVNDKERKVVVSEEKSAAKEKTSPIARLKM